MLWAIDEDARRIISECALRARDQVEAAVRSRINDVMLQQNRAALLGLNNARIHVAANVLFGTLRVPVCEVRFDIRAQRGFARTHRNHVIKPVAAMDVHVMRDRT